MTISLDGTDTLEAFRRAVLDALDEAALDLFGKYEGWKDQDLPALFRVLDEHVMRLATRLNVQLVDEEG